MLGGMTDLLSPVPPPAHDAESPGVSRAIYGMPMFVTLEVADLRAARDWYVDALGFVELFAIPGPDGPVLIHLRRWQFQDLLLRPAAGTRHAGDSISISFAAVYGEIDALAERARAHPAGRVEGPVDTPWNTRDLRAVDPDGHAIVMTAPRPPDRTDARFTADMQRWAEERGA